MGFTFSFTIMPIGYFKFQKNQADHTDPEYLKNNNEDNMDY